MNRVLQPHDFAVIVKLPDGNFLLLINPDQIPEGADIVAIWNGVCWIDLEKIRDEAKKWELWHEAWEAYLIEWRIAYIQELFEVWKGHFEDFTRYTHEQLIEQLKHAHREFEIQMDTSDNSNMDAHMQ